METLDPVLVKAIKLLHSTSKSSTDQLKALLDDALTQRRALLKLTDVKTKSTAEKRPLDIKDAKVKETGDMSSTEKKRKLLHVISPPSKSRSLSSSPDPTKSGSMSLSEAKALLRTDKVTSGSKGSVTAKAIKQEDDSEATDIEENDKESDSDATKVSSQDTGKSFSQPEGDDSFNSMEEFGDLVCIICKSMEYRPGNSLVECNECHSLYHQECHKPPATSQEISDPRTIWYCAKCIKTMKKSSSSASSGSKGKGNGSSSTSSSSSFSSSKPVTTASSAFEAAINQGKESAMQLVKIKKEAASSSSSSSSSSSAPSAPFVFKRTEAKAVTTTSSTSTSKPIGLAGLAANISSKSSTSTVSTSSSSSSSATGSRLQMFKKKAASKAQDKKKAK